MKYEKPELIKVDMKVAETAGAGCKTDADGDGPAHVFACWLGDYSGLCVGTQS